MTNIVTTAYSLLLEVLAIEKYEDEIRFGEAYEKECQIFDLFNKMTEEEMEQYRALAAKHT
jgi:hypothetical protein